MNTRRVFSGLSCDHARVPHIETRSTSPFDLQCFSLLADSLFPISIPTEYHHRRAVVALAVVHEDGD